MAVRIQFKGASDDGEQLTATADEVFGMPEHLGRAFINIRWSDGEVDRYPAFEHDPITSLFDFEVVEENV